MAPDTTTTYSWPDGGVIKRIDVRTQKNGFAVAYLYADDREEQRGARTNIRAAIRLKGWGTLSDSRDGQFVLRVAGMRDGNELITTLREQGFVTGDPQVKIVGAEKEETKGVVAAVKSRSLRWSGILATVGNAMSITEGFFRRAAETDPALKRKRTGQIGMGLSFAVADLPLMLVDEHDNSRQLNLLLKKLTKEYEKNGIEIPKNASIYVETSNKGKSTGQHFQDFLHQFANQIKCSFEVVASGFAMKEGLDARKKAGGTGVPWKTVAGAIFGPGFLASLLIPEKKIDEQKYAEAGSLKRFWMRVQSNPLSIGGLLGYSNTILTYASAHGERKTQMALKAAGQEHTNFYRWDYAIPSVMIGANGLYAMSKKTVGGNIDSAAMVQDAYRIASQIINKQPDGALRDKAVEVTARFFGQRMEIKEHYPEARERLAKELDSQRQNPWFELQGLAPYTPAPKKHGPIHGVDAETPALAPVLQAAPAAAVLADGRDLQSKGIYATEDKAFETFAAR